MATNRKRAYLFAPWGSSPRWLFKERDAEWTPILKKLSAATEGYDKLDYFKADEELD